MRSDVIKMRVCILASGSKGNCVYLEHENKKILIDIGITYKQLRIKLNQIGVSPEEINAVFITHEHMDHVIGLRTFSNNVDCNFYLTKGTLENLKNNIHETLSKKQFKIIKGFDEVDVGDVKLFAVPTHHDAKEPIGFKICCNNETIIYIQIQDILILRYMIILKMLLCIFLSLTMTQQHFIIVKEFLN